MMCFVVLDYEYTTEVVVNTHRQLLKHKDPHPGVSSLLPTASDTRHGGSKFQVAAELSDVTLRRSAEKFFVLAAKV